jgi:predicted TIM-barrel fold metal-dependent hydrolase
MKLQTKLITGFIIGLFVIACNAQQQKSSEDSQEPNISTPGFIIDSHIHYKGTDEWEASFLEIFEKWNAVGCILVKMKDLERGIKFAKAHPARAIPYAGIDIDSPSVLEDIRQAYDMSYRGLGELFARNEWNYDDPKYDPIWALADTLGLPVCIHTGILGNGQMSRMRPGYLGTIAIKFPNLIMHAAHFGNPWYNEAGEITRRNKNVYFDLTGSSLLKKDNDPGFWKQFLWWTPYLGKPHMPRNAVPAFQKIVFATDQSPDGLEENIIRFNKVLDACEVSRETRRKCYYETMAKIHNINVSKYLKTRSD